MNISCHIKNTDDQNIKCVNKQLFGRKENNCIR